MMDPQIEQRTAHLARVPVEQVRCTPIDYDAGSPATGGLWRVDAGGATWFVKLLRHPLLWPLLGSMPPPAQQQFVELFPWRFELDMALSPIADLLPDGIRAARLERYETLDEHHVLTWWEWIEQRPTPWSDADYARAARALGRLAARRREGSQAAADTEIVPDLGACGSLGYLLHNRVVPHDARVLGSAEFWEHPVVVAALEGLEGLDGARLRVDVQLGVVTATEVFDRLTRLPQTLAHGDASIQNLLIGPDGDLVVIDWGFGGPLPVGFDLGQLLVGGAHAGLVDPDDLPRLQAIIVPAYLEGLEVEGGAYDEADVVLGHLGGLWVRSAFTALPYDALDGDQADGIPLMRERLRLTRALLDLAAPVVGFEPTVGETR